MPALVASLRDVVYAGFSCNSSMVFSCHSAQVWPALYTRDACVHFGPHKWPVNFQRFALCRQDLRPVRALLVICNGVLHVLSTTFHHYILNALPYTGIISTNLQGLPAKCKTLKIYRPFTGTKMNTGIPCTTYRPNLSSVEMPHYLYRNDHFPIHSS